MFAEIVTPHHFPPLSSALLVLLTFLCIATFRSLVVAYSSKTRSIPGPFWARFSRLWYLLQVSKCNFHNSNIELHKRYGPVVRIAPNEFSVDNPEAIKTIYGHGTQFNKSPWYYASGHPTIPDLFTDRDARRHGILRRKVASLYAMTTLLHMEPCAKECTEILVERFKEFAHTHTVFNLQYWLQCYAFDVIGLITVAKRFGFLDDGKDSHKLFPALHAYLVYCTRVGIYNELHPIMYKINQLLRKGGSHLRNFVMENIEKRAETLADVEKKPGSGDDFLTKALQKSAEDPENFTMREVFATCMTNIGAGSDTTSISLCAILWYLLKCPRTYEKVRDEIDALTASGQVSTPVSFKDAQKMLYLQAVIKEALRMHPATGLPLGRVVPKGGTIIAGRHIPEGSVVGVNTWVAHYNTEIYGKDAAEFRPERWLQNEQSNEMMERCYMPFGLGSRTCIGKNISLMEISVLIPELIRNFDFELVNPEADLECENNWFVKQKNVFCRLSTRNR